MITRIIISTVASLFVAQITFSQMKYSRTNSPSPTPTPKTTPAQPQSPAPPRRTTTAPIQPRPTSTPAPNGRDLALTPFHVWAQKSTGADSTSTCIDMKSDDGRIYDIDFVTTGPQVTGVKIHKINGEALR
jgi:hypothetical protein